MTMSCSCVNSKINAFNRKLGKIMKCHEHVIVVRNYFSRVPLTRHGLHLHKLGKEVIAKHVAVICTTIKKTWFQFSYIGRTVIIILVMLKHILVQIVISH